MNLKAIKCSAVYYGSAFLAIIAVTAGVTSAIHWIYDSPARTEMHRKTEALQQRAKDDAERALAEYAVYEYRAVLQQVMLGKPIKDGLADGEKYVNQVCNEGGNCGAAQLAYGIEGLSFVQFTNERDQMVRLLTLEATTIEAVRQGWRAKNRPK